MSNVIHLNVPSPRQSQAARHAALIDGFARQRRFGDDVFWLKENAELLNILECTGAELDGDALSPHAAFYTSAEERLGFFPQYYRFLLSICLDLEDLGMPGTKGEALAHWIAGEGLAQAELSDLQRAEAQRLMMRRGVNPLAHDTGLEDRLRSFIDRPATFAMPNKKAAYELTHIVFYLSEYGRRDPGLSAQALISLEFAGILAFLDQNADLLAEICVALRYAGQTPSAIWEDWLERELCGFAIETGATASTQDNYHDYFVCNWSMALAGRRSFARLLEGGRMAFHCPAPTAAPLRAMSECLFDMGAARSDDWQAMRPLIEHGLSEADHAVLHAAEGSTQRFEAFFAGFARAGMLPGMD